jgi:predicted nucleotidyltransferase
MDLHPDFRDLLAEFARNGVRFILVGGYAVGHHAKPRATKDMDLLVAGDHANLARVAHALDAFGAPARVVEAVRELGPAEIAYLGVAPVRVDIMRSADGIDAEQAISRAVWVDVGGLDIPVIALDDLLANKRAAGREQDIADVALLERVARAR